MRKRRIRAGAFASTMVFLFALACHDGARFTAPPETTEEQALNAYEAHLLAGGSTATVAKIMREAVRLEDGQVLKFGPVGFFEGDAGVVRRASLPDGREAVVAFGSAVR